MCLRHRSTGEPRPLQEASAPDGRCWRTAWCHGWCRGGPRRVWRRRRAGRPGWGGRGPVWGLRVWGGGWGGPGRGSGPWGWGGVGGGNPVGVRARGGDPRDGPGAAGGGAGGGGGGPVRGGGGVGGGPVGGRGGGGGRVRGAGGGGQRGGMGAELHAVSPVFAAAFDQACALLEAELGVPVAEVVLGPDAADGRADQTVFAQAGVFAVGAGLVALRASCGITPDAVAGHSVGEVTAAYAAGVLSLEGACALVAARARLMQALPGGGAMTAGAAGGGGGTGGLRNGGGGGGGG